MLTKHILFLPSLASQLTPVANIPQVQQFVQPAQSQANPYSNQQFAAQNAYPAAQSVQSVGFAPQSQTSRSSHMSAAELSDLAEQQRQAIMSQMQAQNPTTQAPIETTTTQVANQFDLQRQAIAQTGGLGVLSQQINQQEGNPDQAQQTQYNMQSLSSIQAQKQKEAQLETRRKLVEMSQNIFNYSVPYLDSLADTEFAKPPPLKGQLVGYNPVFRCAHSYIDRVFAKLATKNKFHYEPIRARDTDNDNEGLVSVVDKILMHRTQTNANQPVMISKLHTIFNFTEYNRPNPMWITFIRHPVKMFMSDWYFCRHGSRNKPAGDSFMCDVPEYSRNMDIGTCLRKNDDSCVKSRFEWHQYICGNDPACYTEI